MTPNIELAKTRDFGEIINDTFLYIKQNWKQLAKSYFTFCGFFILAGTVLMAVQQYKLFNMANNANINAPATYEAMSSLSYIGVGYFVGMFFLFLGYFACTTTVLCYMVLYKEKGNIAPGIDEIWAYFKYYFLRTFGGGIVILLLNAVGFMLCLIPGLYLYPILGLIFPIMIMENESFGNAFNRSFQLIKNNWWVTAATILVTWIIVYFIIVFFTIPVSAFTITSTLMHPTKMPGFSLWSIIANVVIQQVCQLFLIIPIVTVGLCYFNLAESKEGTSLLDRINKFGTSSPQTDLPTEEY